MGCADVRQLSKVLETSSSPVLLSGISHKAYCHKGFHKAFYIRDIISHKEFQGLGFVEEDREVSNLIKKLWAFIGVPFLSPTI